MIHLVIPNLDSHPYHFHYYVTLLHCFILIMFKSDEQNMEWIQRISEIKYRVWKSWILGFFTRKCLGKIQWIWSYKKIMTVAVSLSLTTRKKFNGVRFNIIVVFFTRHWHEKRRLSWRVGRWESEEMLGRAVKVEKSEEMLGRAVKIEKKPYFGACDCLEK